MTRKPFRPSTDVLRAVNRAETAADPDNPELTDEQLAAARPFAEVFPDLMAAIARSRGRPKLAAPRQAVTLRLSPETIARFKAASGRQWRARMSEALDKVGK